jgi:hypothetical protein
MKSPSAFLPALLAFIVVVLAALLVGNELHPYWVDTFLVGRTFTSTWSWLSPSLLALTWGYDVLLAFAASMVLGLMLPGHRKSAWIVGLGVALAALHVLTDRDYPSPDADFTVYVEIYGGYLMPVVGAALGAIVVHQFHRFRGRRHEPVP